MIRRSIKTQHLLGSLATAVLMGAAMAFTANAVFSEAFLREQQTRGEELALHAVEDCIDPVLTRDYVEISDRMGVHEAAGEDVEYIFVLDASGTVVYHSFDGGFPADLAEVNRLEAHAQSAIQQLDTDRGRVLDIAAPILEGRAGEVHIGLSQQRVLALVARMSTLIAAVAVLLVGLSAVSVVISSHRVTRPLVALADAVERVGQGDLGVEVPEDQPDEVRAVAESFNLMSRRLKAAQAAELRNADLQHRINEILRLSLDEPSLDRVLQSSLEIVLAAPWLSLESKGAILLTRENDTVLDLRASVGLADAIRCACSVVPFGTCICGAAAESKRTEYRSHVDADHVTEYGGMEDHGHYCVPILSGGVVLGVLNTYLAAGHEQELAEREFLETIASTIAGVVERHRGEELRQQADTERAHLLDSITSVLVGLDLDKRVTLWNPVAERLFGITATEARGALIFELDIPWDPTPLEAAMGSCAAGGDTRRIDEVRYQRLDGGRGLLEVDISAVLDDSGERSGCLLVGTDVTEHRELEAQLRLAQKLESVGRLAAGIAHEINTPIQYVGDNVTFVEDAIEDLMLLVNRSAPLMKAIEAGQPVSPDLHEALAQVWGEADLGYLSREIPRALGQAHSGTRTVAAIVSAMRVFSHMGSTEKSLVAINSCVEATITVSQTEWKTVARMEQDLDPTLPLVECNPAELNQVLLNLVVNAAHAIAEKARVEGSGQGTISVTTRTDRDHVEIRVQDDGCGIPASIADKIYEPFFTTKDVGEGTGQGLSIARNVVVNRLCGTLEFETEEGKGTTFAIRLPVSVAEPSLAAGLEG